MAGEILLTQRGQHLRKQTDIYISPNSGTSVSYSKIICNGHVPLYSRHKSNSPALLDSVTIIETFTYVLLLSYTLKNWRHIESEQLNQK